MINRDYEVVIGLEVHAELCTETKIFCGCKNAFGAEVNTVCCPVCMGMPGTLPVLNKQVVDYAIKMGHALNCSITVSDTHLDVYKRQTPHRATTAAVVWRSWDAMPVTSR